MVGDEKKQKKKKKTRVKTNPRKKKEKKPWYIKIRHSLMEILHHRISNARRYFVTLHS